MTVRVGKADQALAVPATPANAVDGPSGFDPSRTPWASAVVFGVRRMIDHPLDDRETIHLLYALAAFRDAILDEARK